MPIQTFYEVFGTSIAEPESQYRMMFFIREFEKKLLDEFSKGNIFGTTHTCVGQEANAVCLANSLKLGIDTLWSNHRCHGHFLAYCGDAYGLICEILGKPDGVCAGRGGSQHLAKNKFFSSGIQGGLASLGVGTAWGTNCTEAISVVCLGDGTMGEGSVYEALNLASILDAPVLFLIEDNGIAQTTKKELVVSGSIAERARPFGIESDTIKSTEVRELMPIFQRAVDYVRDERRPFWLHVETTRLMPHSKGDDTRTEIELADLWLRDCLLCTTVPKGAKNKIENEISDYLSMVFDAALCAESWR